MCHISCNFHIVIFFVTTYLAAGKILTRMWELFWIWLYVCCLLFMFYWIMSTQDKNHQDLSIMPNSIMLYIFYTKSLMLVHSIASLLFLPSLFLDQWLHNIDRNRKMNNVEYTHTSWLYFNSLMLRTLLGYRHIS